MHLVRAGLPIIRIKQEPKLFHALLIFLVVLLPVVLRFAVGVFDVDVSHIS